MEGAKTDTQVSACKPFPPKMVKQPTQPSRQTSEWTRTTDWRLKNYNVSSPGEKSEARRNQCLGREKVPAVKLKKERKQTLKHTQEFTCIHTHTQLNNFFQKFCVCVFFSSNSLFLLMWLPLTQAIYTPRNSNGRIRVLCFLCVCSLCFSLLQ